MKIANILLGLTIATLAFAFTGCVSSDPKTEQQLAGTWQTTLNDSEDGIEMVAISTDTYSLEEHKFECVIKFSIGYPIFGDLATMTYSGKWKASKETIVVDVDKNSIEFSFNNGYTDKREREEFKNEILSEFKKSGYSEEYPILSPITDTFETEDEDGERLVYTRLY